MNEIQDGIFDRLIGSSDITDIVGTGEDARIYRGMSPQSATFPNIVYRFEGGGDVTDNPSEGSNTLWLIQGVSDANQAEAGVLAGFIRGLFRRAKDDVTVAGWVNIWTDIESLFETPLHDPDTGKDLWISGVFVRIRLTKSA